MPCGVNVVPAKSTSGKHMAGAEIEPSDSLNGMESLSTLSVHDMSIYIGFH